MADEVQVVSGKKPYQSKTLWVALVVAVASLIPGAGEVVSKNIEIIGILLGLVFGALRILTKGKVDIV